MWEARFWRAAAERAVRAFANALVGYLVVGMATEDWVLALKASGVAALSSVLLSLIASGVGPEGPSFGQEKVAQPPAPDVVPRTPPVRSQDGPWRPQTDVPDAGQAT